MEYLLASSIIGMPKQFGVHSVEEVFDMLDSSLEKWVNARGVGEYVGLMLLGGERKHTRDEAIRFLRMLARQGKTWCDAFWSVMGKCSVEHLAPEFHAAIDGLSNAKTVEKTLRAMARYDLPSCNHLAIVILWSSALPRVISWSELNALSEKNDSTLNELVNRLCTKLKQREFSPPPGRFSYQKLVESVLPFVDPTIKTNIKDAMRKLGYPLGMLDVRRFLIVFWRHSPEYGGFLLKSYRRRLDRNL